MSVDAQIKPDGAVGFSKAVAQPGASRAPNIRARVILGIIILWALGTALFIATHPPFLSGPLPQPDSSSRL
jgi:hypothetical protein